MTSEIGMVCGGQSTMPGGAQETVISDNLENLMIAARAGSTGALLIDGAGTTVTTTGVDNTVQVGWAGSGTLSVQSGAALKTLQLEAGRSGTGTITIQGDGTDRKNTRLNSSH